MKAISSAVLSLALLTSPVIAHASPKTEIVRVEVESEMDKDYKRVKSVVSTVFWTAAGAAAVAAVVGFGTNLAVSESTWEERLAFMGEYGGTVIEGVGQGMDYYSKLGSWQKVADIITYPVRKGFELGWNGYDWASK